MRHRWTFLIGNSISAPGLVALYPLLLFTLDFSYWPIHFTVCYSDCFLYQTFSMQIIKRLLFPYWTLVDTIVKLSKCTVNTLLISISTTVFEKVTLTTLLKLIFCLFTHSFIYLVFTFIQYLQCKRHYADGCVNQLYLTQIQQ